MKKVAGTSQDPPNPTDLPAFWTSRLDDIDRELDAAKVGTVETIATSPGGLPVFAISYGAEEDRSSQANFSSAVAARNPAYFACKAKGSKPVVLILGPVHGQELENIVGVTNLIHVLETGCDHRGRQWEDLRSKAGDCRLVIVPCGNPDGRRRCPYDSFVGLPHALMTKYGQGTHGDGRPWGWPGAKSLHPMRGDVGILGSYYNDEGINPMHDFFFGTTAAETRAIIDRALEEAPDVIVSLHSNEDPPFIAQPGYVPTLIRNRVRQIATSVKSRFEGDNLPAGPIHDFPIDNGKGLTGQRFNLNSALYHCCGATVFTFECIHGVLRDGEYAPLVNHDQILDMELMLFDEVLRFASSNRLYWER